MHSSRYSIPILYKFHPVKTAARKTESYQHCMATSSLQDTMPAVAAQCSKNLSTWFPPKMLPKKCLKKEVRRCKVRCPLATKMKTDPRFPTPNDTRQQLCLSFSVLKDWLWDAGMPINVQTNSSFWAHFMAGFLWFIPPSKGLLTGSSPG